MVGKRLGEATWAWPDVGERKVCRPCHCRCLLIRDGETKQAGRTGLERGQWKVLGDSLAGLEMNGRRAGRGIGHAGWTGVRNLASYSEYLGR